MSASQPAAADRFRQLHAGGLLVLPNAWDAGSARLVESLGAKAIATTSAAVAWSHGYPDGDALPVPLLLATVKAIVRAVRIPVSVDSEGGYSDAPDAVGDTIGAIVDAGGVGINIEDGGDPPDRLCAKIERAKAAALKRGVDLFVNARTDVYLRGLVPAERRVDESLARAARYRGAGADGIFVPGLLERGEIERIAAGAGLPLNVLAWPGLPPAAELEALGVRRLSAGSGIAQVVLAHTSALAADFLRTGASEPLAAGAIPYADLNRLMMRT